MSAGLLPSVIGLDGSLVAPASRVLELSPLDVIQELRGLVASLPLVSLPEQLLSRGFVTHHLARISMSFDRHPEITPTLVALIASPWAGDEWIVVFARLANRLELVIREENDLGLGHCPLEVRIAKALRFIETHYDDPCLTLRRVADQVGLSFSYLAHTLKQQTGQAFVAHLRRHRVEAARRLLEETVLSVKEVAAAAGYQTPRQLERDFKRLHGVVPTAIRQAVTRTEPM
jgi:AraC-like DNA-binding protein